MKTYKCSSCSRLFNKNDNKQWIKSYCTATDRFARLILVKPKEKKIKMYELDFGDTNFISQNPKEIVGWIESDIHNAKKGEQFDYRITIKHLSRKEIANLHEWS